MPAKVNVSEETWNKLHGEHTAFVPFFEYVPG